MKCEGQLFWTVPEKLFLLGTGCPELVCPCGRLREPEPDAFGHPERVTAYMHPHSPTGRHVQLVLDLGGEDRFITGGAWPSVPVAAPHGLGTLTRQGAAKQLRPNLIDEVTLGHRPLPMG
jgi:hypothetical protein